MESQDRWWLATSICIAVSKTYEKGNMMYVSTYKGSFFSLHSHKVWLVLLALGALVLLAACGGSTSGSGSTPTPASGTTSTPTTAGTTPTATTAGNGQTVTITSSGSFAFSPATLTVKVGTTVTWTN